MNWANIWINLFGTTVLWGLDIGFWSSLLAVAIIVILMNLIFWIIKPKTNNKDK